MIDDDDTDCLAWAEPHIPLAQLPRMKLDVPALRAAAHDLIRETPAIVRMVFESPETDQRVIPHMRRAIEARAKRKKESDARLS